MTDLFLLLELVCWQIDPVLLPRAEQLCLQAVNLLVQLLDVGCLADLLIDLLTDSYLYCPVS